MNDRFPMPWWAHLTVGFLVGLSIASALYIMYLCYNFINLILVLPHVG